MFSNSQDIRVSGLLIKLLENCFLKFRHKRLKLVFWALRFFNPKLRVIDLYNLNLTNITWVNYCRAKLWGYCRVSKECHPGRLQFFCDALSFFVCVALVFYTFAFNNSFIERFFVALYQFCSISNEPECRSLRHEYRLGISPSDRN
jgi:hypothetical protein